MSGTTWQEALLQLELLGLVLACEALHTSYQPLRLMSDYTAHIFSSLQTPFLKHILHPILKSISHFSITCKPYVYFHREILFVWFCLKCTSIKLENWCHLMHNGDGVAAWVKINVHVFTAECLPLITTPPCTPDLSHSYNRLIVFMYWNYGLLQHWIML